ncbi:Os07g0648050 [Oryza sativa Japonica Group]|uniref:Os07g0648050 protein n=1 Tax=Oryza sativa subsp. japonica TaxID=39947 RepID=A0A0N7KNY7_ORYSJ|nr:Os07g0648050 [Oryza sativa Japonica Group]
MGEAAAAALCGGGGSSSSSPAAAAAASGRCIGCSCRSSSLLRLNTLVPSTRRMAVTSQKSRASRSAANPPRMTTVAHTKQTAPTCDAAFSSTATWSANAVTLRSGTTSSTPPPSSEAVAACMDETWCSTGRRCGSYDDAVESPVCVLRCLAVAVAVGGGNGGGCTSICMGMSTPPAPAPPP